MPSRSTRRACANLQVEQKKLLTPAMQAALERGPDWVKDHLNDQEIERVRNFLEVEEQIEFRCRGGGVAKPKPPAPPPAPVSAEGVPLPDRNPNREATRLRPTASLAKPWRIRIRHRLRKPRLHDEHSSSCYSRHGCRGAGWRHSAAAFRRGRARHRRRWRRLHDRPQRRQCVDQDHGDPCRAVSSPPASCCRSWRASIGTDPRS